MAGEVLDGIGVMPRQVSEPSSVEELAATLAAATDARRTTVISGGGTKLEWGRTPRELDLVVRTSRLDGPIEHRYGDLTVTAAAGVRLSDLNRALARHRQWLPIDSAFEGATLGGIVATNDAGPHRQRYGTPRDLLIGIGLALADGRVVKAGGHVVKNVAGYDLGKLVSGSFGCLAAIANCTFKLLPVPQASATVVATYGDPATLARDAIAITASQIEPAAVDLQVAAGARRLLVRCASSPAATREQVDAIRALVPEGADVVAGTEEGALWQEQIRAPWSMRGAVIRLSWLPASLPQVLALLDEVRAAGGATLELRGRVGAGAGLLQVAASADGVIDAVVRLRAASDLVRHVVVLRAETAVRARVDVWGPPLPAAPVLRALKEALDPAGILNAGRGPV